MTIELHIENNAGSLHIPADFGLTFYYLPNLPDESSSSSSEEEEHVAIEDKKDKEDAGLKAAVQPVQQLQNADVDGMEWIDMDDVGSSDGGSIMAERELRTDLAELTKTALYGAMGTSAFERREMESWFPHHAPLEGERGSDTGKPESDWWQHSGYGTSSEDLMSGPMQNAGTSQTTADTMQQKSGKEDDLPRSDSNVEGGKKQEGQVDDVVDDGEGSVEGQEAEGGEGGHGDKDDWGDNEEEQMKVKMAFMGEEARNKMKLQLEARVRDRVARQRHRNKYGQNSSIFASSVAEINDVVLSAKRVSPCMEGDCVPAVQAIRGAMPTVLEGCVPELNRDAGRDNDLNGQPAAPPKRGKDGAPETGPSEELAVKRQEGCTAQ